MRQPQRFLIRLACVLIAVSPVSCGPVAVGTAVDTAEAKQETERIAEEYFKLARAGEWRQIESLYHPRFFEAMPLETWRKILPNVEAELGTLGECSLETWNISKKLGTDFTGTLASLSYTCKHEKYDASVTFTVAKGTGEESFSIFGQNFNSIGFLIE